MLALTAAAATLVVVGAWLGWRVVREAYRASARGTGVEVHLAIPGYGEGSSPVPLLIDGTTEGGARVRGVRLLSQTDLTLTLAPGTYAIEAVGSPVTASGGTYRAPEGNYEVRVGDGSTDVTAPDGSSSGALEMRYDPVSPGDVTDDDLAAIRAWMVDEGVQGVDGYVSAVEAARRAAG